MIDINPFDPYIGIPFKDRGRDRNGIDCWGLFVLVYREMFHIELPEYNGLYSTTADREATSALIEGNMGPWTEIPPGGEVIGDGVLMTNQGIPSHIGIVAARSLVLHIELGFGSLCQDYNSSILKRRVCGFYRHQDRM